jgi:hypothetical protein
MHFFRRAVPRVNIHTPAGLDSLIDHLADGASTVDTAMVGIEAIRRTSGTILGVRCQEPFGSRDFASDL